MIGSWMGPAGLAAVALGGGVFFMGYRAIAGAIAALPEPLVRLANERLGRIDRAAFVVAVAVAIYLGARQLGHGRAGLYVCVATLMINAAVVAALRVRWFGELGAQAAVVARHRRGSWAQMAGAWIGFAGCALYLLRP